MKNERQIIVSCEGNITDRLRRTNDNLHINAKQPQCFFLTVAVNGFAYPLLGGLLFYCAKKRSKIEPPELLPEEVTSFSFEVEKVSSMRVPFGAFEPGSTDIETTTPSV